jgi:hypothetical protein
MAYLRPGPGRAHGLLLLLLLFATHQGEASRSTQECPELGDALKTFHPIENHGHFVPNCFADVQPKFNLHQRVGTTCVLANTPATLATITPCIAGVIEHLVVIYHGFTGGPGNWWIKEMWPKILNEDTRTNVAVLIVDWSKGAAITKSFYQQAAANTRFVGAASGLVVSQIDKLQRPSNLTVHCIGHSMGAHVCGFLGQALQKDPSYGRKLDRITGSDPAGPLFLVDIDRNRPFSHSHPDWRLDRTDAARVDVIHTDGDSLGTMVPLGHTDFYAGVTDHHYGSNQACCYPPQCDHEEAITRLLSTITARPPSFDTVTCTGPSNTTLTGCTNTGSTATFGYFYNGSQPGIYGIHLPNSIPKRPTPSSTLWRGQLHS